MRGLALAALLWGCETQLSEMDSIYSRGADHSVLCGMNVDNKNLISNEAIEAGLERARIDGTVLHLYTHRPAGTVDESTIELVLAGAADRDLGFVTYRELADGTKDAGLAFSFDDRDLRGWHALRPLFDRYGAKVTFFISQFFALEEEEIGMMRELAGDGHAIEYHSTNHLNAEEHSAANGVEGYIAEDILPDLQRMREAGFDPTSFAYPYGARTHATDAAVLHHFRLLRAISYTCPY
jgi:peptidoglycan/xylan/chitin deacetylase (PgdA/CDA1 family)